MTPSPGEWKFFARNVRPVISVVTGLSPFLNFPQYTFFLPLVTNELEADRGVIRFFLPPEGSRFVFMEATSESCLLLEMAT